MMQRRMCQVCSPTSRSCSTSTFSCLISNLKVVTNAPKAFKKTKANWSVPGSTLTPDEEEDEKPQIAETSRSVSPPPVVKKKKGGLLTAAQVREEAEALAAEERRKDAERERERRAAREERIRNGEEEEEDGDDQDRPDHQRTVYRDRSGKIVDMKKQREEELKQERDARAREEAKKDWGKGLVQRNEQAQVARRVQEAAGTSFAR
jgi:pre-mRNA-splicing factor CWC26